MACETGKTFTSLKIANALADQGKRVLFLVPSPFSHVTNDTRMDSRYKNTLAFFCCVLRYTSWQAS
ncbi:hypothetical protein AAFS14_06605 [Bartonella schoenbuchensis]